MTSTLVLLAAVVSAASSATVPLHQMAAAGLVNPSLVEAYYSDEAAPGAIAAGPPAPAAASSAVPAAAFAGAPAGAPSGAPSVTPSAAPSAALAAAFAGAPAAVSAESLAFAAAAHSRLSALSIPSSVAPASHIPHAYPLIFASAPASGIASAAPWARAAPAGVYDASSAREAPADSRIIFTYPAGGPDPSLLSRAAAEPSFDGSITHAGTVYASGSRTSLNPAIVPIRFVDIPALGAGGSLGSLAAAARLVNPSISSSALGNVVLIRSHSGAFATPADPSLGSAEAAGTPGSILVPRSPSEAAPASADPALGLAGYISAPASPAGAVYALAPTPAGVSGVPAGYNTHFMTAGNGAAPNSYSALSTRYPSVSIGSATATPGAGHIAHGAAATPASSPASADSSAAAPLGSEAIFASAPPPPQPATGFDRSVRF